MLRLMSSDDPNVMGLSFTLTTWYQIFGECPFALCKHGCILRPSQQKRQVWIACWDPLMRIGDIEFRNDNTLKCPLKLSAIHI